MSAQKLRTTVAGLALAVLIVPLLGSAPSGGEHAVATFAGGCFWCMEPPFEKLDGVVSVVAGYTGGKVTHPTYEQVSSGNTGHYESIQVTYDPSKVDYATLLDVFWHQINPTDPGGQFVDRGPQYRTAIFYHDETQRQLAETSKTELANSGRFDKPIVTAILPAGEFWPAEAYHQDFYEKNPVHYKSYRHGSGRDAFLEQAAQAEGEKPQYVKPSPEEISERLTSLQFRVTQQAATEQPFANPYWDNHREGIYVDVVSGEPLFSSLDKYDSGTGWPSFTRPLNSANVVEKPDGAPSSQMTEVRSAHADSHLGHVFPDGPGPTGERYCINSAALRFIPKDKLVEEGYGEYLVLFEKSKPKKEEKH